MIKTYQKVYHKTFVYDSQVCVMTKWHSVGSPFGRQHDSSAMVKGNTQWSLRLQEKIL